ncbi:hypothetical protein IEC97_08855 [Neobacillus cucumis]|uniref:hypothetical protein n=1 Tax=Neobacillus cucumis TaxID=1740721 RepID=UPI0018DF14E9|nr:hypothetical protein [Neobacillus cucumis]MBI0577468.1 hypothetical protein [Neobacillus cucumis]
MAENPFVYVEDFSGNTDQAKIQAAIDFAIKNARKTVIASDKDYHLTGTVVIKQGVKLLGSYGTRFIIGANVRGFELQKDSSFSDACVMVDFSGYSKEVVYLDGKYKYYTKWNGSSLKNLVIVNWTGKVSGTGIRLYSGGNGHGISFITFTDIKIVSFEIGIHLKANIPPSGVSSVNANRFEKISLESCIENIILEGSETIPNECSGNLFTNLQIQPSSNTNHIMTIQGQNNKVDGICWDLQLIQHTNPVFIFKPESNNNELAMGSIPVNRIKNNGKANNRYVVSGVIGATGNGGSSTPSVKNLSDYSSYKSGPDWIPAFNQAFTDLTVSGGGILQIPVGTYNINSTITIPANVHVMGAGVGVTTIRLSNGVNTDMITLDTHSNCGISYLTIRGNCFDASPSVGKDGLVLGRTGLNATTNEGNMPNVNIHDIEIRDIGGNGFHCYRNTWVYALFRITIEFCTGYGAWIESTDNLYDTFSITANGNYGLYVTGSNNRFSNMKIIFNGRGFNSGGNFYGNGTDLNSAGVYCKGTRNTFVNIECQENYGHGFVFDGAKDADLVGLLADKNGYSVLAPDGGSVKSTPTAVGYYFINSSARLTGMVKATNFNTKLVSQACGYYIDSTCTNISLDFENDATQGLSANLSYTSYVTTSDTRTNVHVNGQYNDFLASGLTLTNKINAYDGTNFQFGAGMLNSYTVTGNEIYGSTNWSSTPRLGTLSNLSIMAGRIYLVRVKVKATADNYFLRLTALYDESPWDAIKKVDGNYKTGVYTDVSFVFKADRNSSKLSVFIEDKIGTNNVTQKPFYASEFAIIDITDVVIATYLPKTVDKVVSKNYFLGSRKFS